MSSIYLPTRLIFGEGKLDLLGEITASYGDTALLVTGKSSMKKAGILDRVLENLDNASVKVAHFDEAQPNPTVEIVDKGAAMALKSGCNIVIGLGGGSAIDAAKAIAVMAKSEGSIYRFFPTQEGAIAITDALPIIAVPTTAGSGTEADPGAVITHPESGQKPGIGSSCMYPAVSIIDPILSLSMPKQVTAATGVDVLYHAMEAYVGKKSNIVSDAIAEKAIHLVATNLRCAYENGDDLKARANMALASTLAGMAINTAGTVMLHAMSHPVSGHFNAVHGAALSAMVSSFIKYNLRFCPDKFAHIAKLMGVKPKTDSLDSIEEACLEAMESLLTDVDLLVRLSDLGVVADKIEVLVDDTMVTMKDALDNNPGPVERINLIDTFKSSL